MCSLELITFFPLPSRSNDGKHLSFSVRRDEVIDPLVISYHLSIGAKRNTVIVDT